MNIDNTHLKIYLCVHEFLDLVNDICGHNNNYRKHTQWK